MQSQFSLEALEVRALLAVTLDAQGWTNFTRDPNARTIYVSSSTGNDKYDGTVSAHPVKTLARARALVRSGYGDWMLLKAGDVWWENLPGWSKSGKNKDFPLLISSYGKGERPVLQTGSQDGINTYNHFVHDVAIVGILFHANTRDPDSPDFVNKQGGYGLHTLSGVDNLLIENCVFDSYMYNLSIQGTWGATTHIGIRRNVIVDSYPVSSPLNSGGLYMSNAAQINIDQNVFDRNGGRAGFGGLGHNIYLAESTSDVYIRGNIIADAAHYGLQARGGGTIEGNVFLRNPIGMMFGNGRDARAGGVHGSVSGNVFMGTADMLDGSHRGWGLEVGNIAPGSNTIIAQNIFTHDTGHHYPAIWLNTGMGTLDNKNQMVGINDLTITGNIVYRWNSGLRIEASLKPGGTGPNSLNGLLVQNNDFQRLYTNTIIEQGTPINKSAERFAGNRYYGSTNANAWFRNGNATMTWGQWYSSIDKNSARAKGRYDDPERTIESYSAALGGKATQGSFITQARLMARRIWNRSFSGTAVVEYVRMGFKERKIPPKVTATNLTKKNNRSVRSSVYFLFDKEVSSKLSTSTLTITNRRTKKRINSSSMKVSYDQATNRATWTFPGLDYQMLPTGDYNFSLSARGIVDAKGATLDGNYDGFGGDDFVIRVKIKGTA